MYRSRPLIVTVAARLLVIREKGRRDRIEVPIDAVYDLGMKIRARALAREKAERKARYSQR